MFGVKIIRKDFDTQPREWLIQSRCTLNYQYIGNVELHKRHRNYLPQCSR